MLTIKQIAQQLGISVTRARLCVKKAAVKPAHVGRINQYDPASLQRIIEAHENIPTRKRNAKPTTSTQAVPAVTTAEQGSEATLPPIDPVEGDSQTLPESSSSM